jgi:hypothetical protein
VALGDLRASPLNRPNSSERVTRGTCTALQWSDPYGQTRPARPIRALNLGNGWVDLDTVLVFAAAAAATTTTTTITNLACNDVDHDNRSCIPSSTEYTYTKVYMDWIWFRQCQKKTFLCKLMFEGGGDGHRSTPYFLYTRSYIPGCRED